MEVVTLLDVIQQPAERFQIPANLISPPAGLAVRQLDSVLLPFLEACTDTESRQRLEQLIEKQIEPTIRRVIQKRCHVHLGRIGAYARNRDEQEAEELFHDTLVHILARLDAIRSSPDEGGHAQGAGERIASFAGYVAAAAYRTCDERLRRKYPARQCLKNRLRYLLTHTPRLAMWQDDRKRTLCGLASWRDQMWGPPSAGRIQQLTHDLELFLRADPERSDTSASGMMMTVFQWLEGPIGLDQLTAVLSALSRNNGTERHAWYVEEVSPAGFEWTIDERVNIEQDAERRDYLRRLWKEIVALPARQRAALLLNLRDERGCDTLALLPMVGVASRWEIARVLGIREETLALLWRVLPLADDAIASLLHITRRQVINLRKAARARLARRVEASENRTSRELPGSYGTGSDRNDKTLTGRR